MERRSRCRSRSCFHSNTGSSANCNSSKNISWVSTFNIHYHLGIDGLSFPLVLLTTFLSSDFDHRFLWNR